MCLSFLVHRIRGTVEGELNSFVCIESNCVCIGYALRTRKRLTTDLVDQCECVFKSKVNVYVCFLKKWIVFNFKESPFSHNVMPMPRNWVIRRCCGAQTQTQSKTHASNNNQNYNCTHQRATTEMKTRVAIIRTRYVRIIRNEISLYLHRFGNSAVTVTCTRTPPSHTNLLTSR